MEKPQQKLIYWGLALPSVGIYIISHKKGRTPVEINLLGFCTGLRCKEISISY
jgi:hypothetical protein